MRFEITIKSTEHSEIVPALAWSPESQLVTCGDDKQFVVWSTDAEVVQRSQPLANEYVTCVSWLQTVGKVISDLCTVGCSDGSLKFITKANREKSSVKAHHGTVTCVKWSHDGGTLVTSGEDGTVKTWSPNGNQRSTLLESQSPVYCIAWSPDSSSVLACTGNTLAIIPCDRTAKQPRKFQWKAHDGIVLACDWSMPNNLIVSGGEDCRYKIWDSYGRPLYVSYPSEHVITEVKWCPNGEYFAVGSFNQLRLCDRSGWTLCRERLACGSIMQASWTQDGTQMAAGCGDGSVCFVQIVDRAIKWRDVEARLTAQQKLRVHDIPAGTHEELSFPRERVVEFALGYGHLIVTTITQCFVYQLTNFNTPVIFDLRHSVSLIRICATHFLTIDSSQGILVYQFDGRTCPQPRFPGMRPEFITKQLISTSPDTIAVVDTSDNHAVHFFEPSSGRNAPAKLRHSSEIEQVSLSQFTKGSTDRMLALLDRAKELFLVHIKSPTQPKIKLHTHVDSMRWNDDTDALAAIADKRLSVWLYPNAAFVDRDLLPSTIFTKDTLDLGDLPLISAYNGSRVTIRRADGVEILTSTPALLPLLYETTSNNQWAQALRICRLLNDDILWGCLAAIALTQRQLDTARDALAKIYQVAKVEYINYIKSIPSEDGRNAEYLLLTRKPDEALRVLLQAKPPLVYRAIKVNIRLCRWDAAFDLAVRYKSHIDTVLYYRQQHLDMLGRAEENPKFMEYSRMTIDPEAIRAKKQKEREDERERSGHFRK